LDDAPDELRPAEEPPQKKPERELLDDDRHVLSLKGWPARV